MNHVTVIGAGLAGSECAWQLAQRGISVTLREMKPEKLTPAHQIADFAELCCSNSLRAAGLENAVGLLKEELRQLGSLLIRCADETAVPAGGALAVDRHGFSRLVTERVRSHPLITVVPGEVTDLPEGEVVVATGPLTSDALADRLMSMLGGTGLRPAFLRRSGAFGELRQCGHGQRLFRVPVRQGDAGLHQLPHGPGGVSGLLAGADPRPGGGGSRL